MGYTLTIGDACIENDGETIELGCVGASLPEAPSFGEPTDCTSSRWPSYTAWTDFTEEAGIFELFYGQGWDPKGPNYRPASEGFHRDEGMLRHHPGVVLITKADVEYVAAAKARWMAEHPGSVAGFSEDGSKDHVLARLMWLDFWFRWAVENCPNPVLKNS